MTNFAKIKICLGLVAICFSALTISNAQNIGKANLPSIEEVEKKVKRIEIGGLKVAFLESKKPDSSVTLRIKLRFGDSTSLMKKDIAGDFAGQMLMKGTRKHSAAHLKEKFGRLTASANISGDVFSTWVSIKTKRKDLPETLKLVKEVLREPKYSEDEFNKLKQEVLKVVSGFRTNSSAIASRSLGSHLNIYPVGHPNYSGSIKESVKSISSITIEDTKRFYRDFYGGSNGEITVVGDFDEAMVKAWIRENLANWKSNSGFERVKNEYKFVKPVNKTISAPNKDLAHFVARLNLPIRDDHRDYPALFLATYILGNPGYADSLFAKEFSGSDKSKDKLMAIFYANSLDDFGGFIVFGNYEAKNRKKIESVFDRRMRALIGSGFIKQDVAKAKRHWQQKRKNLTASDSRLAGLINNGLFLNRTLLWERELERKILALSVGDLNKAFKKHIKIDQISMVKAGDFEDIRRLTERTKVKK